MRSTRIVRATLLMAAALAALLFYRAGTPRSPSQDGRVNVVLVSLDTLRPDHLGIYGHTRPTSPCIDAFARDAIVFENAFAQAGWTLPSHLSMLTSLYSSGHGVTGDEHRLGRGIRTLPETLQQQGYDTAAFTAGHFVSRRYGFDRGFDVYEEEYDDRPPNHGQGWRFESLEGDLFAWLDDHADRAFFVFVHAYDTHEPFIAHDGASDFTSDYAGPMRALENHDAFVRSGLREKYEARSANDLFNINGFLGQVINQGRIDLSEQDVEHLIALYDNEIRFVDTSICRLVEKLDSLGLRDETLMILTSDHGQELMERGHGHIRHGTLYDEVVHVPLIVRIPDTAPARSTKLVQIVDIPPTVLAALGLPPDPQFRGLPLLPLDTPGHPFVIAEGRGEKMLRTATTKLLARPRGIALYDLVADPGESVDLAATKPDDVRALHRLLLDTLDRAELDPAERVELSEKDRAQLRALGYLD